MTVRHDNCTQLACDFLEGGGEGEHTRQSNEDTANGSRGRRAKAVIGDAVTEIQGLHAEIAHAVSSRLGLRSLR